MSEYGVNIARTDSDPVFGFEKKMNLYLCDILMWCAQPRRLAAAARNSGSNGQAQPRHAANAALTLHPLVESP